MVDVGLKEDNGVTNKPDKTSFFRKNSLYIVIVVLVIIGAFSLFVFNNKTEKKQQNPSDNKVQLEDELNSLNNAGKTSEAEMAINNSKLSDTQKQIYLASVYINADQPTKAIEIYKALDKKNQLNQAAAENAAELSYGLNNSQDAIYFYEKAISLAEKNTTNPVRKAEIVAYQQSISDIKASGKANQ